ncbi:MAG: Lrp/AsnC family transcriptional regulator [Methanothrix sp.]|nr:Lrp/AsnC family transcriptional regulator [Methanothrix sp.]MCX8207593.1 Lrp/AsnC family transcriptional regulator [Methanothrix sp.]
MELKLTSKEKLVLYGLTRYPGLSDIDLASSIDVDRSTIFKSKRKFRDWQLIKLLNVPSGGAIGAEILSAIFMRFPPGIDGRESLSEWTMSPSCVYCVATATDAFSLVYSRNLTEFKKRSESILSRYRQSGMLEDFRCVHLCVELSSYQYNVPAAVSEIFRLDRKDVSSGHVSLMPADASRMSDKDRLTLYAFVRYPSLSDLELSKRTGISRPTISGKRSRFFDANILLREAHVEWQRICCELMCFYHLRIRQDVSTHDAGSLLSMMGSQLFYYMQPGDVCGAMLSSSFSDLKEGVDAFVNSAFERDLIDKRPYMVVMPLRAMRVMKLDYAPAVAEMLRIEKEI